MKDNPGGEGRTVTEIRFISEDQVTMAEGHQVHTVNCTRVVERPEGLLEVGFGWTNGERIILHTSVQILREFVPQLIEDLRKKL